MEISDLRSEVSFILLQEVTDWSGQVVRKDAYKNIEIFVNLETSGVRYLVNKKCSTDRYMDEYGFYDNLKEALDKFNSITLE